MSLCKKEMEDPWGGRDVGRGHFGGLSRREPSCAAPRPSGKGRFRFQMLLEWQGEAGVITAGTGVSFASPRGRGSEDYGTGSYSPSFLHLHFLLPPPSLPPPPPTRPQINRRPLPSPVPRI